MEIKDNNFETIYFTKSDEHGDYKIDLPAGIYPFVTAVRDYGEKYLEYWCSNLSLSMTPSSIFALILLKYTD